MLMKSGYKIDHLCSQHTLSLSRCTDASQGMGGIQEKVSVSCGDGKGKGWQFGKVTVRGWGEGGKDSSIRSHRPRLPSHIL